MKLINADAAIDALNEQIEQCNKALGSFDISLKDEYAVKVERASLEAYKEVLENLPSAEQDTTTHGSNVVKKGGNDEDRTTDDLISRQAMLDGIDKLIKIHFDRTVVLYKARKVAEDLPSVQPEPRTAYWTKDIVGSVVCSNCGGIRKDNRIGHTQWCNCCGCFMRGE